MSGKTKTFNSRQILFKEIFVGTLIYAVVLGFFNDYTSIVYAKSFSTIFLASVVLEILTYLAFVLKKKIVGWLKGRPGLQYRILTFFSVWLVMFLSKFVFIWAVDSIFGDYMNINGFFGILWIVLSVTIVHKLADYTFKKLGDSER
jgi:uncharacterized membrane protein YvlD (DUF360 family)